MSELLLGCGRTHDKRLGPGGEWQDLTTLDINSDHNPDVVWDMEVLPLPFADDSMDEIHAYEVLEHTGALGDWKFFFDQFADFWRILKPSGIFYATVPHWNSMWAFGDPSHKRIINDGSLSFLDQMEYVKQVGYTTMSDFRFYYKADLICIGYSKNILGSESNAFSLQAMKPARGGRPYGDAAVI